MTFDAAPARRPVRRLLAVAGLLALGLGVLVGAFVVANSDSASAANVSIAQCNGIFNVGGQTVQCEVTIVNNLTDSAATTGSIVTLNGGAPTASTDLVTTVNQCNGSGNGGGGTVACRVHITNNISVSGPSAATAATVNQCNDNQANDGLGSAPNTCSPYPATTSGATITQCNDSGDGGGLVFPSHCDATGTVSSTLPVTVNQCNGSGNGGGGKVNCSTTIVTNVVDTAVTTTLAPGATTTAPGPAVTTTTSGSGVTTPAEAVPATPPDLTLTTTNPPVGRFTG